MSNSTRNLLEKELESNCTKKAKSLNIITYKFVSPAQRGVPDRIFIFPTGVVVFVEFKREGLLPTKLQQAHIDLIRAAGANVEVCDSPGKFDEILARYRREQLANGAEFL